MTRKYLCDNCGKEVEKKDLYQLDAFNIEDDDNDIDMGELCSDCTKKVRKFVKDGFQ